MNEPAAASIEKRMVSLQKQHLCDACLGRQFADFGEGIENEARGRLVRMSGDLSPEAFHPERMPETGGLTVDSCDLCGDLFPRFPRYIGLVQEALSPFEFETFLIGVRMPEELEDREQRFREEHGVPAADSMKSECKRRVGKELSRRLSSTVSFEQPDVVAILDVGEETVELDVRSIYVYGTYNKYTRNLPQTYFHCPECRGDGCESCGNTGSRYDGSVAGIIKEPFLKAADAEEGVFHGGGREDVDVRCLGKREFVLELKRPRRRDLPLEELRERVHEEQEKVEIHDLEIVRQDRVQEIKEKRARKRYRAVVETSDPVSEERVASLSDLEGTISQRTPFRVQQSRSDQVREREIYRISGERKEKQELVVEVEAEAGTYIKEFVTGDGGRTTPSISGHLNLETACRNLDVIWVEK